MKARIALLVLFASLSACASIWGFDDLSSSSSSKSGGDGGTSKSDAAEDPD